MYHSLSGANAVGDGMSAGSPRGAPASTHCTTAAISASVSERSLTYSRMPTVRSRCQGGISRRATRSRMARAQGRVSS